jgi:hypothetical protein
MKGREKDDSNLPSPGVPPSAVASHTTTHHSGKWSVICVAIYTLGGPNLKTAMISIGVEDVRDCTYVKNTVTV